MKMERITHLISYKFYMDAACVELKFTDGNIIVIDTISAQNKVSDSMYQWSELNWLIFNKPLEYMKGTNKHGLRINVAEPTDRVDRWVLYYFSSQPRVSGW